ncbi:MAG TPA: prenyltransferase/squalene oxidase repeat-containing protein [Pirellulales bacterium]|nr:prenyltransferase/squalene oxidase repeat-containing protein [Pirellulales bacterium]
MAPAKATAKPVANGAAPAKPAPVAARPAVAAPRPVSAPAQQPAAPVKPAAAPVKSNGSAAAPNGAAAAAPAKPAAAPTASPAVVQAVQPAAAVAAVRAVAPAPATTNVLAEFDELQSAGALSLRQILPPIAVSLLLHMALLITLGLMTSAPPPKEQTRELVAIIDEDRGDSLDVVDETPVPIDVDVVEIPQLLAATNVVEVPISAEPSPVVTVADIALDTVPAGDVMMKISTGAAASIVDSRSEKGRMRTVVAQGGNEASEAAVAKALDWISRHQMPDGGWSIDHTHAPSCNGKCKDPGSLVNARMGATALAVLPFLGAGQTHKQGKYKKEVQAGLFFIANSMKITPNGGDCTTGGGSFYSHGLCAIALCEAYAMTQDKGLADRAQLALNYIAYAQDPVGGGWRYAARQPGDTSVVGWQLMALKSGHMAFLPVRPETIKLSMRFLDSVQAEGGAMYGYTSTGKGPGTTAVGLLCRMYLGWKHDEPALEKGIQYLSKMGPSKDNVYFNYYATQVLHHYEGELWSRWNEKMRDQLIDTQSKNGHEAGSWFTGANGHMNEAGGRLYCTSLSCMTLEVYYRHLPLYKKSSTDDEF